MKNFAQLEEDDLEQIRTRIENTLRDHHRSFLGFFPGVSMHESDREDEISFHAIPITEIVDHTDETLPPDLTIDINSNFEVTVKGKATDGSDSGAVVALIKSAIHEYLAKEGFIEKA